jgi:hypothetical protein
MALGDEMLAVLCVLVRKYGGWNGSNIMERLRCLQLNCPKTRRTWVWTR